MEFFLLDIDKQGDLCYYSPVETRALSSVDRVPGYEPVGHRFESCRARQKKHLLLQVLFNLIHYLPTSFYNQLSKGKIKWFMMQIPMCTILIELHLKR